MLDQALKVFDINPDVDFNVMRNNQDLHGTYSSIFLSFKDYIRTSRPDLVIVHGDTTTAAAVAHSCFLSKVPIAHIEAGLRTYNLDSPFPEEFNRQLISKIASLNFAPTNGNKNNLILDGVSEDSIYVAGNTIVDALDIIKSKIEQNDGDMQNRTEVLNMKLSIELDRTKFVLVTAHRRENFGSGLESICLAISELALIYPNTKFIFPVHLNPNVQELVHRVLLDFPNVILIEPLDYFDFLVLLSKCYFVMSDSGGIQEEAPSFHKPLILLRDTTERPEVIELGLARMVGVDKNKIIEAAKVLLDASHDVTLSSSTVNPFGDGRSSTRISDHIVEWLGQGQSSRNESLS